MNTDIASLLKAALQEIGCDPSLIGDIDSHSTIALDFHDRPSIYVSRQDDDVWLWGRLGEYHESSFDQQAPVLLKGLMQGYPFIHGEHPSLVINDGYVELKALLRIDHLEDARKFAEALSGFFECIYEFSELLKK